jgi:hypothetical protein
MPLATGSRSIPLMNEQPASRRPVTLIAPLIDLFRGWRAVTTIATSLTMLACAGHAPPDRGSGVAQSGGNDCIGVMELGDWQVLDSDHLLLWGTSHKRAYHLTLSRPLFELRFEEAVAVVDNNGDGRICPYGGDTIITRECTGAPVTIAAMNWLSEERTAALANKQKARGLRNSTTCEPPPLEDDIETRP